MPERRDYTFYLTVHAPQLTDGEADGLVDGLHLYVQDNIAPITGQWEIEREESLIERDWLDIRPIGKRKSWQCERCSMQRTKHDLGFIQRVGRQRRTICQPCHAEWEAVRDGA